MKKTHLLLITFVMLLLSSLKLSAQDDIRARQDGKNIIIEYDLQKDAKEIFLYISTDGGKSFEGPMKFVTGDLKNVKAGFNKKIKWEAVLEIGELKSDIRFKVVKKLEKEKETFFTMNVAIGLGYMEGCYIIKNPEYNPEDEYSSYNNPYETEPTFFDGLTSFGFTFGQVKKSGWYVSAITNFNFKTKGKYEYDFNGDYYSSPDLKDDDTICSSGKVSSSLFSFTVGGVVQIFRPIYAYAGLGYGFRNTFFETIDGKEWIKYLNKSCSGVNMEAGFIGNINGFVLSAGVSTINFKAVQLKIGIGWSFTDLFGKDKK